MLSLQPTTLGYDQLLCAPCCAMANRPAHRTPSNIWQCKPMTCLSIGALFGMVPTTTSCAGLPPYTLSTDFAQHAVAEIHLPR